MCMYTWCVCTCMYVCMYLCVYVAPGLVVEFSVPCPKISPRPTPPNPQNSHSPLPRTHTPHIHSIPTHAPKFHIWRLHWAGRTPHGEKMYGVPFKGMLLCIVFWSDAGLSDIFHKIRTATGLRSRNAKTFKKQRIIHMNKLLFTTRWLLDRKKR